jgi:hypothetical protein
MVIRKDLLVTEEIAESSDLRTTLLVRKSVTVLPHRCLLLAPGNLRARLGALLKIRVPDLSNPSKPTEKELTSAKNWKDSDSAKQRSPGLCRDKAEAREIDLTPAIPNLIINIININANGRRQALLVCSLPLVNPNGQRGL